MELRVNNEIIRFLLCLQAWLAFDLALLYASYFNWGLIYPVKWIQKAAIKVQTTKQICNFDLAQVAMYD